MTKRYQTFYSICVLLLGIFGGIAGTAFSMGMNRQRINNILTTHTTQMVSMKDDDIAHEKATQKELDRLAGIIASQITVLQEGIFIIGGTIADLRTDIQVLKVIIERIERDIQSTKNPN